MGLTALVMRFLIWVVVLLWSLALLRRLLTWMVRGWFGRPPQDSSADTSGQPQPTHPLVRDPICGLYIPKERAIALRQGEQELHFCSVACRERYQGTRKYAANG